MDVERFPWNGVGPSALTDLLLLAAGCRQTLHVRPWGQGLFAVIVEWARKVNLESMSDDQYVFVISAGSGQAQAALQADRSILPHTRELGLQLGYPFCCSEEMAKWGEAAIDEGALITSKWSLFGSFRCLRVDGYFDGLSWLSHVPCSPTCHESRSMAEAGHDWLMRQPKLSSLARPWHDWHHLIYTIPIGTASTVD
jgi:hypothetical protein